MAPCRDNKSRIILSPKFLALCFILCAGIFLWWMLYPDRVSSGPYLDSAHGSSYGVLRTSLSTPPNYYGQGNCAHCHEQHASIGGAEPAPNSPAGPDYYLLFMKLWVQPVQSNLFCFGCHTLESGDCGTGRTCQSSWQRTNYSYSYWFGGDTSLICPNSIYKSFQFVGSNGVSQPNFNCCPPCSGASTSVGTSHYIYDIGFFMLGKWGFSSTGAYLNPCDVCHNPHRAKRNYPCSRPSAHANLLTWDVWGDDSGTTIERTDYATNYNYLAPCRYPHNPASDTCESGCEPGPTGPCDGSNLTSYAYVCLDCHGIGNTIYSTRLGRNLTQINWGAGGDAHGFGPRFSTGLCNGTFPPCTTSRYCDPIGFGCLLNPYQSNTGVFYKANYVLNCTDCHEPHGSPNEFLLRSTVNGVSTLSQCLNSITLAFGTPSSGQTTSGCWLFFCKACHYVNPNESSHGTVGFQYSKCCDPTSNTSHTCDGCHKHSAGKLFDAYPQF